MPLIPHVRGVFAIFLLDDVLLIQHRLPEGTAPRRRTMNSSTVSSLPVLTTTMDHTESWNWPVTSGPPARTPCDSKGHSSFSFISSKWRFWLGSSIRFRLITRVTYACHQFASFFWFHELSFSLIRSSLKLSWCAHQSLGHPFLDSESYWTEALEPHRYWNTPGTELWRDLGRVRPWQWCFHDDRDLCCWCQGPGWSQRAYRCLSYAPELSSSTA